MTLWSISRTNCKQLRGEKRKNVSKTFVFRITGFKVIFECFVIFGATETSYQTKSKLNLKFAKTSSLNMLNRMFYQQSRQFTRKLKALKQRWWWVLRHSKTILTGIVAFLSSSYRLYLNWRIIRPRLFSTQKSRAANRDVKWRNMVENFGRLPFPFFMKLSTKWLIETKKKAILGQRVLSL